MTSIRDRIMGTGKDKPKAKAEPKAEPKPPSGDHGPPDGGEPLVMPTPSPLPEVEPPKPKPRATSKQLNGWRDGLASILGDLEEVATDDPYLIDAQAFATQARVSLEKQIKAEGGDRPTGKPAP